MLEKLFATCQNFKSFVFEGSYSMYELVLKLLEKVNETIDYINSFVSSFNSELNKKEYSTDITNKRKLSPLGDFSGTLLGRTILSVFADIKDALSLCKTLIQMVNDRESIGTIYDGGFFIETEPPTIVIEGGLF